MNYHPFLNLMTDKINLYQKILSEDLMRATQKPILKFISAFYAAISVNNYTKPTDNIAEIYEVKRVILRPSNFFRKYVTKDAYMRAQDQLLRIASTSYDRQTGLISCMCYVTNALSETIFEYPQN